MIMETTTGHPTDTAQHELVLEYCKEAEGRIIIARSFHDAITIKEEWCNRFKLECESELLINATSAYLDGIIARRWKKNQS